MKKSIIVYTLIMVFLLSSCSSQKGVTSSTNGKTYTSTQAGHKKFTPGQDGAASAANNSRLDSLKSRMAMLEAQLESIQSGESSKNKKATQKEVAEVNKEIQKIEKEEIATTEQPKDGHKKFVAKTKTKEEIAAAKAKEKAKAIAKAKKEKAEKEAKIAANTSKPKDNKKPSSTKKPTSKGKATASNTTKKTPTTKKPVTPPPPPKPKVVYKTISEKVLGNYFMDGSTSSQNMFCLHKKAPVGTKVTVVNPMNGRRLTLKVVGKIPNLAEDMGVAIKITYSAARQLNLRDKRFELKCTYKMPFTVNPGVSASTH